MPHTLHLSSTTFAFPSQKGAYGLLYPDEEKGYIIFFSGSTLEDPYAYTNKIYSYHQVLTPFAYKRPDGTVEIVWLDLSTPG